MSKREESLKRLKALQREAEWLLVLTHEYGDSSGRSNLKSASEIVDLLHQARELYDEYNQRLVSLGIKAEEAGYFNPLWEHMLLLKEMLPDAAKQEFFAEDRGDADESL